MSDRTGGIFSDNFINGNKWLFSYISMLFTMMLTHGVVHIPENKCNM